MPALAIALTLNACGNQSDATDPRLSSSSDNHCYVQLFDDAGFRGESIFLRGAGEYPDLDQLPEGPGHWGGQAGSFKTGPRTAVTFWRQPGLEGDAVAWTGRTAESAVDAPRSMKISCRKGDSAKD